MVSRKLILILTGVDPGYLCGLHGVYNHTMPRAVTESINMDIFPKMLQFETWNLI